MQGLGIIFTLAWRNLWRNHRRTIIMLAAISIGAWAMIFMTSLMRGMVNDMLRDGISALPGHVQVHHPDYRDDPSVNNLVARTSSEISASLTAAGIDRFAARGSAESWYDCILRLHEQGLTWEAATEFEALLEAFPDFREPAPE